MEEPPPKILLIPSLSILDLPLRWLPCLDDPLVWLFVSLSFSRWNCEADGVGGGDETFTIGISGLEAAVGVALPACEEPLGIGGGAPGGAPRYDEGAEVGTEGEAGKGLAPPLCDGLLSFTVADR